MGTPAEKSTTITVKVQTWARLSGLKARPGESFDDVISRLIDEHKVADQKTRTPEGGTDRVDPSHPCGA